MSTGKETRNAVYSADISLSEIIDGVPIPIVIPKPIPVPRPEPVPTPIELPELEEDPVSKPIPVIGLTDPAKLDLFVRLNTGGTPMKQEDIERCLRLRD